MFRVLTPGYAIPEQLGEAIVTTASLYRRDYRPLLGQP